MISVVVPTYCEADNVSDLLEELTWALSRSGSDYEVLVIDDESPDGTADIARQAADDLGGRIRVIVRTEEPDLSRSVVRGIREAAGQRIVVMDADFQHPPEVVPELAAAVNDERPVAVGSRYADGGEIRNWPLQRRLISRGAATLAKIFVPPVRSISDPISGFFAIHADAVDVDELTPEGYKILVELVSHIDPDDAAEIGFVFVNRRDGETSLDRSQYSRFLKHVVRCGLQYRVEHSQTLDLLSPYLLNPIAVGRSVRRGWFTHSVNGVDVTYRATALWETLSLRHTLKKESRVLEELVGTLRPTDVFWDVGANLGVFACTGGQIVEEGNLVAVEPHPENVDRLKRNIEYNGISATVIEGALSDSDGTTSLSTSLGRFGNQRHAIVSNGTEGAITVDTVRGDRLVDSRETRAPTVIKIDVEGAEGLVIDGLNASLTAEACRAVYCEVHPELMERYGYTPGEIEERLVDMGFAVDPIHTAGGQTYFKGTKA